MTMQVYECQNTRCALGTRDTKGKFSGGLSPEGAAVLGLPPDTETGEGICPTCGEKGKSLASEPAPHKGTDPYQAVHDKIGEEVDRERAKLMARVADPEDEMTQKDADEEWQHVTAGSQAMFERRAARMESADNAS